MTPPPPHATAGLVKARLLVKLPPMCAHAGARPPPTTMFFIGLDISHAGTRALALDLEAACICAESWAPHDWIEGLPAGYREQNPAQWIDAVARAIRQCLDVLGGHKEQVAAIGVAGPTRGLVLLDAENRIIRPAKLAGDRSVKRQAEEIARAFGGAPGLIELAGQSPGVDSAAAEWLAIPSHAGWLPRQSQHELPQTWVFRSGRGLGSRSDLQIELLMPHS